MHQIFKCRQNKGIVNQLFVFKYVFINKKKLSVLVDGEKVGCRCPQFLLAIPYSYVFSYFKTWRWPCCFQFVQIHCDAKNRQQALRFSNIHGPWFFPHYSSNKMSKGWFCCKQRQATCRKMGEEKAKGCMSSRLLYKF